MDKKISLSIEHIKKRIERLKEILEDKKKIPEKYYYESLKLNIIEMGKESKILNDFIKEQEGKWDDIISKEYYVRISLTHYYKTMNSIKIEKHLENDFQLFIEKINELEKRYCKK